MMFEYRPLDRIFNSKFRSNIVLTHAVKTLDWIPKLEKFVIQDYKSLPGFINVPKMMFDKNLPIYEFYKYVDKIEDDVSYDLKYQCVYNN